MSDVEPDHLVAEVLARERELLDPAVRGSKEAVKALLHADFREFGASGRVWDRESVLDATASDALSETTISDVRSVRLADDVVLLTYVAHRPGREALRSSVWVRVEHHPDGPAQPRRRWQLLHHQGTVRSPAGDPD